MDYTKTDLKELFGIYNSIQKIDPEANIDVQLSMIVKLIGTVLKNLQNGSEELKESYLDLYEILYNKIKCLKQQQITPSILAGVQYEWEEFIYSSNEYIVVLVRSIYGNIKCTYKFVSPKYIMKTISNEN